MCELEGDVHRVLNEILARNDLTQGLATIFDGLADLPLQEALATFGERLNALFDANRELARFLDVHSLLSGSEAAIIYRQVLASLYAGVALLLDGFKRRGFVRSELDTLDVARVVGSVLLSDIAQRFVFGAEHSTGESYFPGALQILLRGMEPPATARVRRGRRTR